MDLNELVVTCECGAEMFHAKTEIGFNGANIALYECYECGNRGELEYDRQTWEVYPTRLGRGAIAEISNRNE